MSLGPVSITGLRHTTLRQATLGVCALALASAGGCGSLGGDDRKPKGRTPVVSLEQLRRYSEDNPARAFLGWFRALQRRDSVAAVRYYPSSLGLTPKQLELQRRRAAHALDPLGPPRIKRVVEKGSRATVYATFRKVEIAPNGRVDQEKLGTPGFGLRRERGDWKLASNRFLEVLSKTSSDGEAQSPRSRVVSRSQLERFPSGRPARAFLEWFRALQLGDSAAATQYYRSSLGLTRQEFARQRGVADQTVRSFASPRITRVVENGARATVYVVFRKTRAAANGRIEVEEVGGAAQFVLQRERGNWKLVSNQFLELLSKTPTS